MTDLLNLLLYLVTFGCCGDTCIVGIHKWMKRLDYEDKRCLYCSISEKEFKTRKWL